MFLLRIAESLETATGQWRVDELPRVLLAQAHDSVRRALELATMRDTGAREISGGSTPIHPASPAGTHSKGGRP